MREDIHPIEDAFHRIQSPVPAVTSLDSNDQVHDAICVELWNAGLRHHEAQVAVSDRNVVLTGVRSPAPLHRKCLASAKRLGRGRQVIDETIVDSGAAPSIDGDIAVQTEGSPAIFVTRYCGLDVASIRAGIASAIATLEKVLSREPDVARNNSVLIYRNVRGDTVTIEVGYKVSDHVEATAHDAARRGKTPFGPMLSEVASNGGHALAKDFAELRARAREHGMGEPVYFWQQLPDPHDPWPADRPTRLFAAWK